MVRRVTPRVVAGTRGCGGDAETGVAVVTQMGCG